VLQSVVSSLLVVPVIKILRLFYPFISACFELWVYWYAKDKNTKHMFGCSISLFSIHTQ